MTIQKYIYTLIQRIRNNPSDSKELRAKLDYARAYAKGTAEIKKFRDRAIESEIGKAYSEGAQIAILFNKDVHPDEYEVYQTFRAECKTKVDAKIKCLKDELEAALKN